MLTVIGPYLGPGNPGEIRIFIGLPFRKNISKLLCQLKQDENMVFELEAVPSDDDYRIFSYVFSNLNPGEKYNYQFLINEEPLELEGGLKYEDCYFKSSSEIQESDSFVLTSCHNPFETEKGSAEEGWTMWEALYEKIKSDPSIRLLLMAGDQVYNDDVEHEFIIKLKGNESNQKLIGELRNRFIKQYLKYWENLNYRRVLAKIPSLAIWDDHDITDGWGSRTETFEGNGFKRNWQTYFNEAHKAFSYYQANRNKNFIPKAPQNPPDVFTNYYDWGDVRFYLLDFRTERHSKLNQIWTNSHKNAVFESLKKLDNKVKTVFFVSPVIPLRTNFHEDRRLTRAARFFFKLRGFVERFIFKSKWHNFGIYGLCLISLIIILLRLFTNVINSVSLVVIFVILFLATGFLIILKYLSKIPEIPDLSDDLKDGLSSDPNRKSLVEILDKLFIWTSEGDNRKVLILSGDIHVGGITEIVEENQNTFRTILQIVSSPISNKPMPKVVEGLTSTTSEMVLQPGTNRTIFARNIFYNSKRNFVQIFPNRLSETNGKPPILFHFEGHRLPTTFKSKFF